MRAHDKGTAHETRGSGEVAELSVGDAKVEPKLRFTLVELHTNFKQWKRLSRAAEHQKVST
jgi:hypothetical protein